MFTIRRTDGKIIAIRIARENHQKNPNEDFNGLLIMISLMPGRCPGFTCKLEPTPRRVKQFAQLVQKRGTGCPI